MKHQPKRNSLEIAVNNPSPFLAARIQEDSNLEMEWLWSAGQVTEPYERLYCLQRALYISPANAEVQRQHDALIRSLETVTEKAVSDLIPAPEIRSLLHRLFQLSARPVAR
jgi:hypothetical protein